MPLYRSASELQSLIKNVGANVSNDSTKALLLYRLGKPEKAYEIEKNLPALWKKAGILQNIPAAEKRAEFYKAAAELGK